MAASRAIAATLTGIELETFAIWPGNPVMLWPVMLLAVLSSSGDIPPGPPFPGDTVAMPALTTHFPWQRCRPSHRTPLRDPRALGSIRRGILILGGCDGTRNQPVMPEVEARVRRYCTATIPSSRPRRCSESCDRRLGLHAGP